MAGTSYESYVGPIPHGLPTALVNNALDTGAATFTLNTAVGNEMVIDLNATALVDRVRLWQRLDGCCQERLQDLRSRCWPTTVRACRGPRCSRCPIPARRPRIPTPRSCSPRRTRRR